jgi:hypothetical protein
VPGQPGINPIPNKEANPIIILSFKFIPKYKLQVLYRCHMSQVTCHKLAGDR